MREQVDSCSERFERADVQRQPLEQFRNAVRQRRFIGEDAQKIGEPFFTRKLLVQQEVGHLEE